MSVFKCKICGGTLEINSGETVATCEYCGTKQTLPKLDDEKKANLFDRANHFRRNNDFDKASAIYEQILNEDSSDAESYWSLVLCRYGIEYVEDPVSHKRVPTVNRAQFTSIFDDEDYKAAIQHADAHQRSLYEAEASAINEIQKGILAISQKEEPFDVFICYKETDHNGRRTPDSVLATELYHELTKEGFKVFFSRITLEDKLGTAYEPYIFAALHSAKVMVALGTKNEHFNAVWVKNEWSRFLALIKNGAQKTLIPAYRDMDPYDLPEEFSHLQALDMSKLGFMQDLVRGIRKIIGAVEQSPTVKVPVESGANATALLKRAFIFLEDHNWSDADAYLEKTLDADPENAMAYLGKLMLDLRVAKQEDLAVLAAPFDDNPYYEKAIRYADAAFKATLQGYVDTIKARFEQELLKSAYEHAKSLMESAESENDYMDAAEKFDALSDHLDSSELSKKCRDFAKSAHDEAIYQSACNDESEKPRTLSGKLSALESALSKFEQIPEYKDSSDKVSKLKADIDELKTRINAQKKRNKKIAIISSATVVLVTAFTFLFITVILPTIHYSLANKYVEKQEYQKALEIYSELEDYKDSANLIVSTRYLLASAQLEAEDYQNAYEIFSLITSYKDGGHKYKVSGYAYAQALMANKNYQDAISVFRNIGDYENSVALKYQCYLEVAKQYYAEKNYEKAINWYEQIPSYDKNAEFYLDSYYNRALSLRKTGYTKSSIISAISYFVKVGNYKDAKAQINAAKYEYITKLETSREDLTAFGYLKDLKAANYKDSATIYKNRYAWHVSVVANNDEINETTDMNSMSKYDSWYFHISVSGGEPGAETQLKYKGYFPDGGVLSDKWDFKLSNGETSWASFYYDTPAYGTQGKFTFKVFDSNGNLLAEKSVRITG